MQCLLHAEPTHAVLSKASGVWRSYIYRLKHINVVSMVKALCAPSKLHVRHVHTKCMIYWGRMAADCSHSKAS